MNELKYIIYSRKSSEAEDRQVLSIESQIDELKSLASKQGLTVVEVLTESMSAKAPGRPIFESLLQRIHSGEADGILCWKLDRLARNMIDGGAIMDDLQHGVIGHIITPQGEYKPNDNVLMMAVEFGMANQYIRELSLNVKRGIRKKIEKGQMPGPAPIGYRNEKNQMTAENEIVPDSECFRTVKMLFEEFLKGSHSLRSLKALADSWGFHTPQKRKMGGNLMSISVVHKMLTNPFYCGLMRVGGEIHKGSHIPAITLDEFDRIQILLGRKGKPRPQKHKFPFTGIMECGECGGSVTAEIKKKKLKSGEVKFYTYYHCTKRIKPACTQACVEVAELEHQIENYLLSITIPEEFKDWAIKWLNKLNDSEINDRTVIYTNQQKARNDIQREIDELTKMRFRNLINDEEYLRQKQNLQNDLGNVDEHLRDTEDRASKWLELSEKTFNFACYAKSWFQNGDIEERRMILTSLGSHQVLFNKKLTITLDKPLSIIGDKAEMIRADCARLEPEKMLSQQTKNRALTPNLSSWLTNRDRIRTPARHASKALRARQGDIASVTKGRG